MREFARSLLLGWLVLAAGSACSLWQRGKDVIFEEPTGDPAAEEDIRTTPLTLQERYPYVRFLTHPDRTTTAVVTVPHGAGVKFVDRLKALCTMDDGAEPPAGENKQNPKLYSEAGGGGIFNASALLKPWDAAVPSWKETEDLIFITGLEHEVEEVLAAIDLWYNASPQIEIQVSIFDVTDLDLFERGVIQADGQPILEKTNSNVLIRALGGAFPSQSNPGFGAGKGSTGLGGVFRVGFIDADFQLDAYLQFLKQNGVVEIVSQPSVVTRNGVPAAVTNTEQVPFLKPANVTFGGALSYGVEYRPIGVTLNVVPFLIGQDMLHLVIYADVSRLGREFIVGVDGNNNPITVPSDNKRSATTEVIVRSGDRVVIGGMRTEEFRTQTSKIPILGDIPILGWFFSNDFEEKVTSEIYFVIQAKVKSVPTIEKIGDIFDPFAQQ